MKRFTDRVAVLSSMFGLVGMPRQTSYCATKFAVRGFSESLAVELAETNVRVLSVHPGGVRTNIAKSARIVGAMERNAERLLITPEARVTDVIKRVYPAVPSRFIAWVHRRVT